MKTCSLFSSIASSFRGFRAFDCSSSSPRKVIFTEDNLDDVIIKIHGSFVDSSLTRAGVFLQNRPRKPQRSTKRFSGGFRIRCEHPNGFLRPNLFRGDEDLTNNLTGLASREFSVDYTAVTPSSSYASLSKERLAGVYDCSWTKVESATPEPRSCVDAILYDDQIECGVGNRITGVNISVNVENGTNLAKHSLLCSLSWAGSGNGNLRLHWRGIDDLLEDVEGFVDHTSGADGGLRSSIVLEKIVVTKPLAFQCVVGDEETFEGRKPKGCSVRFAPTSVTREAGYGSVTDTRGERKGDETVYLAFVGRISFLPAENA